MRALLETARKNSSVELVVEAAGDAGRQQVRVEGEERPAGEVDRARGARLVHRHDRVAVASDPGAVAERRSSACPSTMPTSSAVWCAPVSRSPRARPRGRAGRGARPGRACGRGTRRRSCGCPRPSRRGRGRARRGLPRLTRDVRLPAHPPPILPIPPSRLRGARSPRRARSAPPRAGERAGGRGRSRTSLMRRRKWRGPSAEAKRAAPPVGRVWFEPAT